MCIVVPANPLPLDPASAEGAYELIKENTLPDAVKELLDSVDSVVASQLEGWNDRTGKCFCSFHLDLVKSSDNPKELEDMWILQRDISVQLFKVMMGVVRSAADLARRYQNYEKRAFHKNAISALDDSDLELAFTGDARGGYQWLNCLAKDECGWVWTAINNGSESLESQCPACLLGRAIDSESTIRLLITAARLLEWDFFVTSIQEHLACDPWWGPGYWETIEPKANILGNQIRDLLQQCSRIRQHLKQSNATRNQITRQSVLNMRRSASQKLPADVQRYISNSMTNMPMKLDLKQLHQLVGILADNTTRGDYADAPSALRPYNHARMANNYRLAAYCWFVLMYNLSVPAPSVGEIPLQDRRISRTKMRSRTV